MSVLHIRLAPDYDIREAGLGYELVYMDPVMHEWHVLWEGPSMVQCEKAYLLVEEGWSKLPEWDDPYWDAA